VADFREIDAVAKNPCRARTIAQTLLPITGGDWSDWELDFLDHMSSYQDFLTTRQAEKLLELRDNSVRHSKLYGFHLKTLVNKCWIARFDLDSEQDIEFIERLHLNEADTFRKADALRLLRCARSIGEIEPYSGRN
jgi:hypothetical protein